MKKINFQPGSLPIITLMNDISEVRRGGLDLQPEYQRNFVWNDEFKDKLLLSLAKRYPIGNITIRKMDIADGPGVRVSIFMQGCTFNCKNCFNPETHDFNGGKEFTENTINRVLELCENENVEGLSILGGEPMNPKNIEGTTKLAKAFKQKFPNKNLWAWSGFKFDRDLKDKEVVKYLDVLVDGQYMDDLHNPTLKWKGSSNQRVINVQESLKQNEVVLL